MPALGAGGKGLYGSAELDAEGLGGLGRQRVLPVALEDVHAVDAKGLDLDQGLTLPRVWSGHVRVEEEGVAAAGAALDVWGLLAGQCGVVGR